MATNQGGDNFLDHKDNDFDEDVWGVAKDKGGSSSAWHKGGDNNALPSKNNAKVVKGSSSSSCSSVPMDIPDWSKIYGKKYCTKGSKDYGIRRNDDDDDGDDGDGDGDGDGDDDGDGDGDGDGDDGNGDGDDDDGDDGDGDGDDMSIPPHEWLARKLARNQISSFSVCEGMGRTLKGRDLSKVRNTILTKTGFIE